MRMIYIKAIAGFIFAPNPLPKKYLRKALKKRMANPDFLKKPNGQHSIRFQNVLIECSVNAAAASAT